MSIDIVSHIDEVIHWCTVMLKVRFFIRKQNTDSSCDAEIEVEIEVNLQAMVSRPVYPGFEIPAGAHDQIFVCLTIACFLM
jgi:hypothetical protein